MYKILTFFAGALMLCSFTHPQLQHADYQVVPLPHSIALSEGGANFKLDGVTRIVCAHDSLRNEAALLRQYVSDLTGLNLDVVSTADRNAIVLRADLPSDNAEAYQIVVDKDRVCVNGATSAGTFYGIQTLCKAIPQQVLQSEVVFPAVVINDKPRFAYRGALLDVARHPMEADSVKSFIDVLAMHNINRLHWHLTDDQGWRIEIKSYPKLAQISSHRDGTMIGRNFELYDTIPVDGYYTADEAREIVKYAADRHITIIPEIDLPGHMLAALEAYPEMGCTGGPYKVWQRWGVSKDLLCAGNDDTYRFIDAVLSEICEIFPSRYIHIGGDECPKTRWEECPKCQAKIEALGLVADDKSSAEAKLQTYVMSRALETLNRYGRVMIGWDEILEGGAPDNAVVMSWRGVKGAHVAARTGHDAILTPVQYMYFDYCQSDTPENEPVSIGGYVPVPKVYSFEPIPDDFTPQEAAHILGVQANLWREYIKTLSHAQYMELPRMAALCEVQWVEPEQKDYDDFLKRVRQLIRHYDACGYRYATHILSDVEASAD